eukprot:gene560-600_t
MEEDLKQSSQSELQTQNEEVPLKRHDDIDRVKSCPFLLRCFWKSNQNNNPKDYRHVPKGIYPNQEVQIYTWLNSSLREISNLLKDVIISAREQPVTFCFNVVSMDNNGFFVMRRIGEVAADKEGADDNKTLKQSNFEVGEFLDIAIIQPNNSSNQFRGANSSGSNNRGISSGQNKNQTNSSGNLLRSRNNQGFGRGEGPRPVR